MIRAKNCEKLSKIVKVTAKILSIPFFRRRYIFWVPGRSGSPFHLLIGCATDYSVERQKLAEVLLEQK